MSILIVDDTASFRKLATTILKDAGYGPVLQAESAAEAFVHLGMDSEGGEVALGDIELVLMDIQMPELDGIEATKRIKSVPALAPIPILVLTAGDETQTLDKAFAAGANDFLRKPFVRVEFLARVRSLMALKEESDNRRRQLQELEKAGEQQRHLNDILRLSLEKTPIEERLGEILDILLSVSWLSTERKGAFFMAHGDSKELTLFLHRGFNSDQKRECATVSFGKCICGRAVDAGKTLFVDSVDDDHDIAVKGGAPHGHYCVPIKSGRRVLGVIDLNVSEKHVWEKSEEEFLESVADVVAALIERQGAEESVEGLGRVLDSSLNEIYIFDAETMKLLHVNEGGQKNIGYSMRELEKLSRADLLPEYTTEEFLELLAPLRDGTKERLEHHTLHRRKDSTTYPVEVFVQLTTYGGKQAFVAVTLDITERMRSEEELRKLTRAVEQSPVSVVITDTNGTIEYVNPKFVELSGYSEEELIGKNPRVLKSGEQPKEFYEDLWKTISSGKEWRGDFHNIKKNGEFYWEQALISPIKNPEGEITHYVAIKEDVTERRAAEERLRNLSLVVEQTPASTIILNTDLKIEYINTACAEATGYSANELIGESVDILRSDEHPPEFYENIWATARLGKVWQGDVCSRRKDGSKVWEHISISPVKGPGGEITHFVSVKVEDVERARAERSLREKEARLREAQGIAHLGHWEWDIPLGALSWSDEVFNIFGYRAQEFVPTYDAFMEAVHPDYREAVQERVKDALERKKPYTIDHRIIRPDGSVRIVHEQAEVFFDSDGKPLRMIGIIHDITERMIAEEALKESEERTRLILDSAAEGIYGLDLNGGCTFANPAASKLLGYDDPSELIGKNMHDLIHHTRPDGTSFPSKECRMYKAFREGEGSHVTDEVFWRKDGASFPAEYWSHPTRMEGKVTGAVVTFLDVTEQRMMQAEVLKTEKLESVALLAAGIAHDFNNLLTAITGNVSLAKLSLKPEDKLYQRLDTAETASYRATELTKQLLTFARGGKPVMSSLSLGPLLKESVSLVLRGGAVTAETDISNELWPLEADEGQISQVLNNLLINATQAMKSGGRVKVDCKNVTLDEKNQAGLEPGRYLEVTISDEGTGISKENLEKIFDPYFTTKETGTGLGLATCYSVIKNHGGLITVDSTEGVGTTFRVFLPASKKEGALEGKGLRSGGLAEGRGRILIMDDEESVCDLVCATLKESGYEVESAVTGEEAIKEYTAAEEAGKPFSLVIMDLTIRGGLGGKDTIERLLKIDPAIKAIVSSGYSNDPVMSDYERYGFKAMLPKPFRATDLSGIVKKVLLEE